MESLKEIFFSMTEELIVDEEEEEESAPECFGDYGSQKNCEKCPFRRECNKFKQAETNLVQRYGGKYKGRGRFCGKDKF